MIIQMPDAEKIIGAIEKSEMFTAARETFYEIPFWARAFIFCFVITAAVLSKWILPAWANLARARKGE